MKERVDGTRFQIEIMTWKELEVSPECLCCIGISKICAPNAYHIDVVMVISTSAYLNT